MVNNRALNQADVSFIVDLKILAMLAL